MSPASLEVFAPVKLNLFLEVLGRREDGYHELFTVMQTMDLGDRLQVSPASGLEVRSDREDVPGGEENLAARVVRAAERRLSRPLPARILIQKGVPPGSGLGAGSSDAAAALRAVLALHALSLPPEDQEAVAAEVGSDCAFFVRGGLCACRGRGEIVEPLGAPGRRHAVVLLGAPPAPTPEVYRHVDLEEPRRDPGPFLAALRAGEPLPVFNRLQAAAFAAFPVLAGHHAALEDRLGRPVHLSGSGSAFFCLAADAAEARAIAAAAPPGFEARSVAACG